jgi:hypothetical protein
MRRVVQTKLTSLRRVETNNSSTADYDSVGAGQVPRDMKFLKRFIKPPQK